MAVFKTGRPKIIFTDELIKSLVADMIDCALTVVANAHGIGENTLKLAIIEGKRDIDEGLKTDRAKFVMTLNTKMLADIKMHFARISDSPKSHRGSEYHLERKYPKIYRTDALTAEIEDELNKIKELIERKEADDKKRRSKKK